MGRLVEYWRVHLLWRIILGSIVLPLERDLSSVMPAKIPLRRETPKFVVQGGFDFVNPCDEHEKYRLTRSHHVIQFKCFRAALFAPLKFRLISKEV